MDILTPHYRYGTAMKRKLCRALALSVFLLPLLATSCSTSVPGPSVVLIIIDTLRADHLSCYGYHRETSPVIDSLAASGVMMEHPVAQSSWTLPATATIMSGISPVAHGAGMHVPTGEVYGMDPEMPLLAMEMKRNGYETAGFFNIYLLSGDFGFHRGFDLFVCRENGDGKADSTVMSASEWLRALPGDRPFFLALHFFDVHDPYDPPAPFDTLYAEGGAGGEVFWEFTPEGAVARPEQLGHLIDLYDGEIAYVDSQLGILFSVLRELDRSEDILVVLTADHGEEFLEHGYVGHGRTFYPEITEVPIILSGLPGLDSISSDALCGLVDLMPTILQCCSIEPAWTLHGRSLFQLQATGTRTLPSSGINTGDAFRTVSIRTAESQLIWDPQSDRVETYDLSEDPMAQNVVEVDSAMLDSALYYRSTPVEYDPVLLEEWKVTPVLRDLGYIR